MPNKYHLKHKALVLSFTHCGMCENCLTGHPTVCSVFNKLNFDGAMDDGTHRLCQHGTKIGTFFGQSSFSTHAIVNARNAVKVDPEVDLNLLGPAARIAGCQQIIAVDVHESRLALAKELGATHSLNGKEVGVVAEIKAITLSGSHYAVETTGVPAVVRQSLHALRPLGQCAIVGITPEVTLDIHNDLMAEGKSLIGVIEGDSVPRVFIPQLVAYYKMGRFPFDKLVKFYDFDQINEAFKDSEKGITIKPILKISEA